jgi:hypothetical protein
MAPEWRLPVNITNVLIDCQHNDWAWIFGPNSESVRSGAYDAASQLVVSVKLVFTWIGFERARRF